MNVLNGDRENFRRRQRLAAPDTCLCLVGRGAGALARF